MTPTLYGLWEQSMLRWLSIYSNLLLNEELLSEKLVIKHGHAGQGIYK